MLLKEFMSFQLIKMQLIKKMQILKVMVASSEPSK